MSRKIYKILIIVSLVFWFKIGVVSAAILGETVTFNVDDEYAIEGRTQIKATLQHISRNAYFYTEDDWWDSLSGNKIVPMQTLAYEFDEVIYPTLRNNLGSEWKPGIDGDEHITILFVRLRDDAGGFFNIRDEYNRESFALSNEREMLYLNAKEYQSPQMRSFLAHEFQHLITFYQKDKANAVTEELFLNEGRSEYASTLVGYDDSFIGSNLESRIYDFLKQPSNSLTEWKNVPEDYGSVNIFMQYLVEHYGRLILSRMIFNTKVGIESIDDALSSLGVNKKFSDIFTDWAVALYLNDCTADDSKKYCFLNDNIRLKLIVSPTSVYTLPPSGVSATLVASMIKDWSPRWYKFTGGSQNLKLDFNGNTAAKFSVPYIIARANGKNEVKFFNLINQQGTVYIPNFGSDVLSVTLVPLSKTKNKGFIENEPYYPFSFAATIVSEVPASSGESSTSAPAPPINDGGINTNTIINKPSYLDGSLIRARGDYKVYVVNGRYKRWIQNPYIFNSYSHLKWENIIEVSAEERDWYEDSWLVRAEGDFRVYEITSDGQKRWLNVTADIFSSSGRNWEAIFVINRQEGNYYKLGQNIIF